MSPTPSAAALLAAGAAAVALIVAFFRAATAADEALVTPAPEGPDDNIAEMAAAGLLLIDDYLGKEHRA